MSQLVLSLISTVCSKEGMVHTSIQIILLDVNTICLRLVNEDVAVGDVVDEACGVVVCLDSGSICGVEDLAV